MQISDSRIDDLYCSFSEINTKKHTAFTKEEFVTKLEYELLNNPRVRNNSTVSSAIDYLVISEKLPYETIAGFIHNELVEEFKYNKPIKNFKFKNSKNCCIAPYSTLNFDTTGKIRVCCYNNYFILGAYPSSSIADAWNNPERDSFIQKLSRLEFPKGCEKCRFQVVTNNINNALFTKFDVYEPVLSDMPINMEFEFGNICNFECIMCGGKWSSSIRKNREKLPPIISPYDDNFVNELVPFIKHLRLANFLGGEPFLTSLYYKIWDKIFEHNPSCAVYVTTNGSILSPKVREYLTKSNMRVVVSLDSLQRDTYELIRKNGNFNLVIKNVFEFLAMKRLSTIAFCPLIQNVLELPAIAKFCIDNGIALYINTVTKPLGGRIRGIHAGEASNTSVWTGDDSKMEQVIDAKGPLIPEFCLSSLSAEQLDAIAETLTNHMDTLSANKTIQNQYIDFVKSLNGYKYNKTDNI
jgi:MoaA/NifB/PqqE/SkfB family radical SAM enzyme